MLTHAGAAFATETVDLTLGKQSLIGPGDAISDDGRAKELRERRVKGSITGLFPVLYVDETPIHESLAICEWANEAYPAAGLWPKDSLNRARARAIASEMASGFQNLRTLMSSHLFGRVQGFQPDSATRSEISRVFEIWSEALNRSGGPFLFGSFGIADAMYYPVRGRFRTYGVEIPQTLSHYVDALDELPAVSALERTARSAPSIPVYDDYLRSLGGNPVAAG